MSRWPALAGAILLAGCAAHGTLPTPATPVDIATEQVDAARVYAQGDMPHAAALYESLVKRLPDDADMWYRLGNARFRLQQPDEAVAAYSRAIQIDPAHARALYNLGVVRLKQAQSAMLSSAQASSPGEPLRRDGARVAQRLARAGDDVGGSGHSDGGAPPFIVEPDEAVPGEK